MQKSEALKIDSATNTNHQMENGGIEAKNIGMARKGVEFVGMAEQNAFNAYEVGKSTNIELKEQEEILNQIDKDLGNIREDQKGADARSIRIKILMILDKHGKTLIVILLAVVLVLEILLKL
ncbi:MAG: hypothetical protein MHPSP_000068 [Paramarteilia canceri]